MIKLFEKFRFYKKGLNISYSAVVLEPKYSNILLSKFIYPYPEYSDWNKIAHHSTICLGELPEHLKRYWLDEEVTLTVTELGVSDKVVAVKVNGFFSISKPHDLENEGSKFAHITLAINPIDGKPQDSNLITDWKKVEPLKLEGIVREIQL